MATSKKQKRDKSAFEDPTYDHNFKLLFGEPNKHLLISFLNSILIDEGEDIIQDISYVSPEYSVNAGKLLVLPAISDLRVVTESNQDIIIEMQRDNKKGFLERAQYYMGRAISMKLKPGDGNMYDTMRQTIILVIARKNLFGPNDAQSYPDYISTVVPYMLERKQELDNRIMLWKFVEIDRFLDFTRDDDPSAFDLRKQWIHFLGTCADNDEVPEDVDAAIKEAYAQMTVIDEMMQKAQDQVDDSIRLAECIRKEGETRLANKLNQVLGIKKDILEGKSKKDIHAIYPLFDSEEIEVLEDYILEQDCTEIDLVKKLLELKLYI